ncbi:MAG: hypothetical protein A3F84_00855 [Candidatus Handelsmanbacteria bacterium RIFCSPLOWO2_12_FULL_64_10]|uniref:Uncharacterized protein n=1 Tax=Handelsmanbacteria sp. (strain RIFCSPLOWO2_12_FULL_64_10) TaxID=1817868 RepID=A0A1F6C654_HANXR|nr:MAG: hypothetical protein A3F84_00855 [Candidatus Handelsmanbacteria bacterium RIFCSPLOWO2_12_FULL_64_10]
MSRHGVVPFLAACFLSVSLSSASAQDPRAVVLGGLTQALEDYHKDTALLLESVLSRDSTRITLFDPELSPFLEDLQRYVNRTRERHAFAREKGMADLRVERAAALVYAYAGIAFGRARRFPEGHALLSDARALHPGVGQEPSPLSWAAQTDTLGTWMEEQTESWYRKLGQVRVVVSPQWTADSLRFMPLQVEAVTDSSGADAPATEAEKTICEGVRALAEVALRDSIRASVPAFDIHLPRGSYSVRDAQGLLVPVRLSVGDSSRLAIDPRVDLWAPETYAEADAIRLKEVADGASGEEIDAGRIPFGRILEMTVDLEGYERRQEQVFFYRPGFPRLDRPDVIAIQAEPGRPCLYLKEGAGRLKKPFSVRRYLKYVIIPALFLLGVQ